VVVLAAAAEAAANCAAAAEAAANCAAAAAAAVSEAAAEANECRDISSRENLREGPYLSTATHFLAALHSSFWRPR